MSSIDKEQVQAELQGLASSREWKPFYVLAESTAGTAGRVIRILARDEYAAFIYATTHFGHSHVIHILGNGKKEETEAVDNG